MPTGTGKLQLQDYDAALIARGFDAFLPAERYQMINFAYREIARKFPFTWEQSSHTYTVNPGTASVAIQGGAPASASNIMAVFVTTAGQRMKLQPERYRRFIDYWLVQDLTLASNRSTSSRYFLFEGSLYLLPPPQAVTDYTVYFSQYLPDMVAVTDPPVTPQAFDELILDASLVRCHRRAHEMELAADAQSRVNDALDDLLQNDIFQMEERQDRVLPDDSWL